MAAPDAVWRSYWATCSAQEVSSVECLDKLLVATHLFGCECSELLQCSQLRCSLLPSAQAAQSPKSHKGNLPK